MAETPTIQRDNKLPPHEDYEFLRREAIRLTEQLAGKTWTDYNTHDPGITLLEAVCYCLTDLGYRTSFEIKDLLAARYPSQDDFKKSFYTAAEILPVNPVTITDLRKLIIDTLGVRNAWVEVSDDYETPIYLQKGQGDKEQQLQLSYDAAGGGQLLRLRGLYKVYLEYEEDVLQEQREEEVAEHVRRKLQGHRNLCEDFISVTSIEYELFEIEAVLQVNEGTDIEKVNAEVYRVIHNFMSPPVTFYSLEQMLDKGYSTEDIFEGPILRYGFIDSGELERSERYKRFHLSDIMSLVSDIEGVIAIKKFAMPAASQTPTDDFTDWIDRVKDRQKVPRLDVENSLVKFNRSGDRHRTEEEKKPDLQRVKSLLRFLRTSGMQSKMRASAANMQVPVGEYMQVGDYYPMQHTLPAAYGLTHPYIDNQVNVAMIRQALEQTRASTGNGQGTKSTGVSAKQQMLAAAIEYVFKKPVTAIELNNSELDDQLTDIARKFRLLQVDQLEKPKKLALQLRGFLMVFEQVLADYLLQLENLRLIFSFDEEVSHTYFAATLKDVADVETLFNNYQEYAAGLPGLLETESQFTERRNKMLDHLLSRYSENMLRYSSYMKRAFPENVGMKLIADKSRFLSDYIQLSSYRAKAFDYTASSGEVDVWETSNVAGFKKRVSRQLGMTNYSTGAIASDAIYVARVNPDNDIERFQVVLADPADRERILLRSNEYEFEHEAREVLNYILENGWKENFIEKGTRKKWRSYHIKRKSGEADDELVASMDFDAHGAEQEEYEYSFARTSEVLRAFSDAENFHVVEHILLRPKVGMRNNVRKQTGKNTDSVELLSINQVEGGNLSFLLAQETSSYRFNINEIKPSKKGDHIRWRLSLQKNDEVNETLVVQEEFTFYKHLTRRIEYLRKLGSDAQNFRITQTADGQFSFTINDDDRPLATARRNFKSRDDLANEVAQLMEYFSFETGPASEQDEKVAELATLSDPYSLQVTVVLPSWPGRFRDATYRHLLEKAIYMEVPSHIHAYVYWLNHYQMKEFEEAYRIWLQELAASEIPDTEIVNNMIAALEQLKK